MVITDMPNVKSHKRSNRPVKSRVWKSVLQSSKLWWLGQNRASTDNWWRNSFESSTSISAPLLMFIWQKHFYLLIPCRLVRTSRRTRPLLSRRSRKAGKSIASRSWVVCRIWWTQCSQASRLSAAKCKASSVFSSLLIYEFVCQQDCLDIVPCFPRISECFFLSH